MVKRKVKVSGAIMLISLAGILALVFTTNPTDNVIYSAVFFGLSLIFLVSLGYFSVRLQTGTVSPKNRYRIVALSLVLLTLLMFRSAQSLSWVDGIILILIGYGLVFYISRRS